MFPSALNDRSSSEASDKLPLENEKWLCSSTYSGKNTLSNLKQNLLNNASTVVNSLSLPRHTTSKFTHRSAKKNTVSQSIAVFLEDIPGLDINDAFKIDRTFNREIYKHGCIYEKHVAKFKQRNNQRIFGFRDLKLSDLHELDSKERVKRTKRWRYYSKHNKKIITDFPIVLNSRISHVNDVMIPITNDCSAENTRSKPNSSAILSVCENLNRLVYDKPCDLTSWLELIDMQDKSAYFLHLQDSESDQLGYIGINIKHNKANKLTILRKQLSMTERALAANLGSITLKLIFVKLSEFVAELETQGASSESNKEICRYDQLSREWAQYAFTYPQLSLIWRGYLAYLMGRYSIPPVTNLGVGNGTFSRIDNVYKRGLSTLSGIISGRILSHHPQPDTVEHTIDFLADYCHWLVQAGHSERALALWQAVIEFNCFRPSDLEHIPFEQCQLELELYWTSGSSRFGQPGALHWVNWYKKRNSSREKSYAKKSGKSIRSSSSSKKLALLSPTISEINATVTLEGAQSKWAVVSGKLKDIANTCEDALINCSTKIVLDESSENAGQDVMSSILTTATLSDQWIRRGAIPSLTGHASIGKSRAILYRRGKAWVGLERVREAVGWLPSDVINSSDTVGEDEDPERLVLFDDIKPCLLDLWKFEGTNQVKDSETIKSRALHQQRLFLLCFEFLGAYDPEIAVNYRLPNDIRMAHDLAIVGAIQRQTLSPLLSTQTYEFQNEIDTIDNSSNLHNATKFGPSEHHDTLIQAHRCFIDAAITQAANVPSWWDTHSKTQWLVTLSRMRFTIAMERLSNAIRTYKVTSKNAISIWRQCGRSIMSEQTNQQELSLWRCYARGFWQLGSIVITVGMRSDVDGWVMESRRIFDNALTMYPIPADLVPSDYALNKLTDYYLNTLTPRYDLLRSYVDLELGVNPGVGGCMELALSISETNVIHLLVHASMGETYSIKSITNWQSPPPPSVLVKTNRRFGKQIENFWSLLVALSNNLQNEEDLLNGLVGVASTFCYLSLLFDLVTNDQQILETSLTSILPVLARIDNLCDRLLSAYLGKPDFNNPQSETRLIEKPNITGLVPPTSESNDGPRSSAPTALHKRICTRRFVSYAIGGLASFSALRRRNRIPLINEFFHLLTKFSKQQQQGTTINPLLDLIYPSQLCYLLPARVAIERGPLSPLNNLSPCHGLLPPLFLANFVQKLNEFSQSVAKLAAQTIINQTVHSARSLNRHRTLVQSNFVFRGLIGEHCGSFIGYQLELLSACLPGILDLYILSLELERWSSLIGGGSGLNMQDGTYRGDERVRNAFERAVQTSPFISSFLNPEGNLIHVTLTACTPSFWTAHLRVVIWRAYMAFGWMSGPAVMQAVRSNSESTLDPRSLRQAVKAVFYRAVEDVPWAKVLYTDLVRYCPEDVEEVIDLLTERELRLRTPLEEVDLLLTAKPLAQ